MNTLYIAASDALIVARSSDGQDWQTQRYLEGITAQCIAADPLRPEHVYCGTFGQGLWRSRDAGMTWQKIGDDIPEPLITEVAVSRVERSGDYGVVYAGTEPSALYRSEDGGEMWHELPALKALPSAPTWSFLPRPHTSNLHSIAFDLHVPGRLYVAIEQGGVMRTSDAGQTWQDRVESGLRDSHTLATHPLAPNRVYSANGDGYLNSSDAYVESYDGGDTWQRLSEGLQHRYLWGIAVDPANPDLRLVSCAAHPNQAHQPMKAEATIYRKAGDEPWQEVRPVEARSGSTIYEFAVNEAEPGVFYAVSNQGVYHSADTGLTWERLKVDWRDDYLMQHIQGIAMTVL